MQLDRHFGVIAMAALLGLAPGLPVRAAGPLATVRAGYQEIDRGYSADGLVEAVRSATLAAQVSGRIVELRVNAGDRVTKGQVLARIDEREAAQAVAAGRAQGARANAELSNARASLERTRALVAKGFVSAAALDKARAEHDAADAVLAAARAGTAQAQTVMGHAVITAPFSGVVAERLMELGDMAQPGRPMFTLFDPKSLRAVANVPQARIAEIRSQGAAGTVDIPDINQNIKALRLTVLPSADPRTHTTTVRLDLPDGVQGAYPGQFARVRFAIGRAKALVIPASAVAYRSEVAGAYVVGDGGSINLRQLRLGDIAGEAGIEVLAGLEPGETVALDPVAALSALKALRTK
jgi:RND family efflux transporter MFP subunit